MAKILYSSQIPDLMASLTRYGRVVAPIVRHPHSGATKVVFSDYEPGNTLELGYPATVLPPKEFLLPPVETVFEYQDGKAKEITPEKTVLFGLSYEDLEGIDRLRKIFQSPVTDETFAKRSDRTIVIAADRFSPPKNISFDVYLQKLSHDRYAAFAGSPVGQKIITGPAFKLERVSVSQVRKKDDPVLESDLLSRAMAASRGSKIWDKLATECFACGVCSFTCPLCYCFETEDRTALAGREGEGKRIRKWSTCFSEDFADTAAHNFRPERKERIYNWYYHKFVRMPKEYGFSGCVDCNRCVVFCPASINYRKVIADVLAEYEKKGGK